MTELNKLIFWLGCLVAIWLYMSNIGIADLINAPVKGLGKAAETTVDTWMSIKQGNKFNPRP